MVLANSWILYGLALLLGLCLGSFLNVVIYRLPLQLQSNWRRESEDFLGLKAAPEAQPQALNLMFPASHCPQCHQLLKPWHNIPVISFLWLRGKCAHCDTPISIQYPLVELASGLICLYVVVHFGLSSTTALALIFSLVLLTLTGIDFHHQLLPDTLTLPLLWLGLLANSSHHFVDLHSAVIGAIAGYLSLWSIFWVFKWITGKEGMGYGDFKLLAALGAWLGWQQLPLVVLLASLTGAIIGIAFMIVRGRDRHLPMAFGPYLAMAGWICLLWGQQISQAYLDLL